MSLMQKSFSSPEYKVLMVSFCDRWMSVVRFYRRRLLQGTFPLIKLLTGFRSNDHYRTLFDNSSNGINPLHNGMFIKRAK